MLKRTLLLMSIAHLSGCASTCERGVSGCDPFYGIIHENLAKMDKPTSKNNLKPLIKPREYYQTEIDYLNNEWPPKLGLALSGGGTRAASFSIGVMKALNDNPSIKILDNVNLISSVSGGSYANYWYFSQLFYQYQLNKSQKLVKPNTNDDIFKSWNESETNLADPNLYRFQRHLEESSEIMAFAHKSTFFNDTRVNLQYGTQVLLQGFWTPFYWVANGLFDWEANITPFFYFYKDGIDRTYGYVPLDYTLDNYANAHSALFGLAGNIDAEPILLGDMKDFLNDQKKLKSQKTPYFIVNTTARYGNQWGEDGNMEDKVFEFTPWGCHSDLLNIHPSKNLINQSDCPLKDFHVEWNRAIGSMELDLARIVAISGAAVDGQASFVDISGKESEGYKLLGKPFLEIVLDTLNFNLGYTVQNQNTSSWDRYFHKLLPWPFYLADDYHNKDNPTSVHLSDGGHSENLGILPLIRRNTQCIISVDAEQDSNSTFESAKRLKLALERHGYEIEPSAINKPNTIDVHDLKPSLSNAVTEWQIKQVSIEEGGKKLEKPIRIIYIKLASPSKYKLTNSLLDELPYSVVSYLKENPDFPHESTMDIFYSAEQFRAYRDLGYAIANSYFIKKENFCSELNNNLDITKH
jgi:Patatin-like phospholipase